MIDINQNKMKHIMGREGKTHKTLESKYDIKIHIASTINPDNTQTVTIRGKEEQIRAATKEIETILRGRSPQRDRYSTICRFYNTRDGCRKGDRCEYIHERNEGYEDKRPQTKK